MKRETSDEHEVAILARLLGDGQDELPTDLAQYLVQLEFGEKDRKRMHDLAVRNQEDSLSTAEKGEMSAYARAGTVLSILKSKARRVLKNKPRKRTSA